MSRDLTKGTWPLPWWVVTIPALVIAAIVGITMAQPRGWAYVAPARVSGIPAEALLIVGPLIAMASCWVAERFTGRHSLLGIATLPRGGKTVGLRVLVVLGVAWGAAFAIAATIVMGYWSFRASGGSFFPSEILISTLRCEFFIVSGFIAGALIARWHATIWTLAWALFWTLLAPVLYEMLIPGRTSNLEYFLFPALVSTDHRSITASAVGILVIWWVFVIAAFAVTLVGWYAVVAGHSRIVLSGGAMAVSASFVLGLLLPAVVQSVFIEGPLPTLVCVPGQKVEICVTQEQKSVLGALEDPVNEAIGRLGISLPADFKVAASNDSIPAAVADGYLRSEILTLNVGSSGLGDTSFDIGVSVAGLASCGSGSPGATWAFNFASWLAPESDYAVPEEANPLSQFDSDRVLDWYSANEQLLRSCSYDGAGP